MSAVKSVATKKASVSAKAAPIEKAIEKKAEEVVKKVEAKTEEVKKEVKKEVRAAKPAVKKAVAKTAAKATAVKKAVENAENSKNISICLQYGDKEYSTTDIEKMAKDVWVYDYNKKASDLKDIELYVKPVESKVYYVFNKSIAGAFDI